MESDAKRLSGSCWPEALFCSCALRVAARSTKSGDSKSSASTPARSLLALVIGVVVAAAGFLKPAGVQEAVLAAAGLGEGVVDGEDALATLPAPPFFFRRGERLEK